MTRESPGRHQSCDQGVQQRCTEPSIASKGPRNRSSRRRSHTDLLNQIVERADLHFGGNARTDHSSSDTSSGRPPPSWGGQSPDIADHGVPVRQTARSKASSTVNDNRNYVAPNSAQDSSPTLARAEKPHHAIAGFAHTLRRAKEDPEDLEPPRINHQQAETCTYCRGPVLLSSRSSSKHSVKTRNRSGFLWRRQVIKPLPC
jgi:hypothetical protein